MNKEWSDLNKKMQLELKKKDTYEEGIDTLIMLRAELMAQMMQFRNELEKEDFSAMPFANAKGYHNKTIAYSLWHIFRIEDIVVHSLIAGDDQILFSGDYQRRIQAPIITTGNELIKEEIIDFSKQLCIEELYHYVIEVDKATTESMKSLSYEDLKAQMTEEKRKYLESLNVVSRNEKAYWLIDYWCQKDIRGLVQMPLSRHWIMHIEACLRIRDKILKSE